MRPEDRKIHQLYMSVKEEMPPTKLHDGPATGDELSEKTHQFQDFKYALTPIYYDGAEAELARQPSSKRPSKSTLKVILDLILIVFALGTSIVVSVEAYGARTSKNPLVLGSSAGVCTQVEAITPSANAELLRELETEFTTKEFKLKAYESLGGAIRIPYV